LIDNPPAVIRVAAGMMGSTRSQIGGTKPRSTTTIAGRRRCRDQGQADMLTEYFPILIFLLIATGMGVGLIAAGGILGPRRPNSEKLSAYECGFESFEDARMKFDVRFYLVAILFIIFDLEIAFLFPWAVALGEIGMTGLIAMSLFLSVLVVGFVYEWKKGALEWE
jgi:NADH-quinone oxidoreductase subunit A